MLRKVVEWLVVLTSCHPLPRPELYANRTNSITLDPNVDAYNFDFISKTTVVWKSVPDIVVLAESVDVDLTCGVASAWRH